ncbi:MAG: sigma-54 dependent transcriptional regulator [Rhodocyclaceae bacterium]
MSSLSPTSYLPDKLLALPDSSTNPLSIRARALVFVDPASRNLLERIEQIAGSEASVLIQGETGTGKELVARHLHELSGRSGPFVAVNCGAFSENLVEAELFGHESGAFTGAQRARQGWFEAADKGTLFLDEIGDLPQSIQVKLLRVLQEREVVRLGSRTAVPVDVRLITATNVNLERAVSSGHFRMDLFYRINVASLRIPALRERPGDIEALARYFARLYSERQGTEQPRFSPDALRALATYPWPGNIRELENVIHFALLVCQDNTISARDLRFVSISAPDTPSSAVAQAPGTQLTESIKRLLGTGEPELFSLIESTVVTTAFQLCGHNQVRAAELLGVSRNVMRTLLKRYALIKP